MKGRTTFIVAHRLSTVKNADRIVVMKKGKVVESGSYDELLGIKGEFYKLKNL
ncbi:putative multidrug resistance ABC transporter ATP-binding/permease protein YheH [compost metagenome]